MKSCSVAQVIGDEVAVTVVLVSVGISYFTDDRMEKGYCEEARGRKGNQECT